MAGTGRARQALTLALTGGLLVLLYALLVAPAGAASVTPTPYEGNPTCASFGYTTITKFDPPQSGTQAGVTLTVNDDGSIDWSSTVAVDAVLVKGANGGNIYQYPFDTFADTNLITADNASGDPAGLSHVEFCTDNKNEPPPNPGIDIEKTVAETAAHPGDTLHYTLTVTNTGNTTLNGVVITDALCQGTVARSGANAGDTVFNAGDVWTYTCTFVVPTGVTNVHNVAMVCYDTSTPPVTVPPAEKCDTDTVDTPVTPSTTPGGETPGGGTPGGGGVLPGQTRSGRAQLRGPSGCVKRTFRARVNGRSIASVTFFVDGKRVKRIKGTRSVYSIKVKPSKFGFGRHRVTARVRFTAASGTRARTLRLTFRRCANEAIAPRFTG
jgi:uncharacterized repeat protein (TIGR01451 family)